MDKIRESVSNKLKQYRKIKGLTQEEFAEENNISVKTIAQWEQGKVDAPIYIILMLRKELQLSIDQIYGLEISYLDMEDKDIENCIRNYTNDKVAPIYYVGETTEINYQDWMGIYMMEFISDILEREFVIKEGKIIINLEDFNLDVIRYFISKNLMSCEVFEDLDKEDNTSYWNAKCEVNKNLVLYIFRKQIKILEGYIKKLDKNEKGYNKTLKHIDEQIKYYYNVIKEIDQNVF